jgi:hypothetical protein
MARAPSRLIEDEERDGQSLTETSLLITLNAVRYHSIIERVKKLQEMLALQQGRLHDQHLHLAALQEQLKRQERKLLQSSQHPEP